MVTKTLASPTKYRQISKSIKNNIHLLKKIDPNSTQDIRSLVGFNNHLIISMSREFLEAIKDEIGGEIMDDPEIGHFLYYGDN